jgi:hypothetical protein
MGRVIIDDVNSGVEPTTIEDASTDRIYYRVNEEGQNAFYVKDRTYELIAGNPEAEPAPELHQFEKNLYHNKVLNNYILETGDYDSGKTYYNLYAKDVLKEVEIDDTPYTDAKYWEGLEHGYQFAAFGDFNDWATYYEFDVDKDFKQITDSIKDIKADTKELRLFFKAEKPPIEIKDDEILQGLFYVEEGIADAALLGEEIALVLDNHFNRGFELSYCCVIVSCGFRVNYQLFFLLSLNYFVTRL